GPFRPSHSAIPTLLGNGAGFGPSHRRVLSSGRSSEQRAGAEGSPRPPHSPPQPQTFEDAPYERSNGGVEDLLLLNRRVEHVVRVYHPDYNNELTQFLPRTVVLKKPPGAQLGFNIRGGKASQLGIFISKVIPDSDAHRAGLQEGDQVLSVNDVDFQDIEHSKAVEILKTAREITMRVRYFPYNYQRQKERTVH
uniref:PDZ domain-containing protein 11 n=1 Tax=Gallus gallus TaxID=9031 RepID=A0A8V0YWE1_CHICK